MTEQRKHLLVVLGMHRSGTSAMTRALQVLGIHLGDNIMPALADNPKGFWEDMDVWALNEELLAQLGEAWDSLSPTLESRLSDAAFSSYEHRALDLLRRKTAEVDWLGMKDPRMVRLLPLWRSAFAEFDGEVRYLLAVRNPLSVAASLAARDGFAKEKSCYLWLQHMIPTVRDTAGSRRAVLDFDRLMAAPDSELRRVARELDIVDRLDEEALAGFCSGYLEGGLRHSSFDLKDLLADPVVPSLAKEAYGLLYRVAGSELSVDSAEVAVEFARFAEELARLGPALSLMADLDKSASLLRKDAAARDGQIGGLNDALADRDKQIFGYGQVLGERDRHIRVLSGDLADRDRQIGGLTQALRDRDRHIDALSRDLSERDRQIADQTRAVAEREAQIADLTRAAAEREAQIADLGRRAADEEGRLMRIKSTFAELEWQIDEQRRRVARSDQAAWDAFAQRDAAIAERDAAAAERHAALSERDLVAAHRDALLSSTSWRVTRPLREISVRLRPARRPEEGVSEERPAAFIEPHMTDVAEAAALPRPEMALWPLLPAEEVCRGRCLIIDAQWPQPDRDSGSVDAVFMARSLRDLGFSVVFASDAEHTAEPALREPLLKLGIGCLGPETSPSIEAFVAAEGRTLDLVILSRAPCGGRFFEMVRRECPSARVVFNTVDLHGLREEREARLRGDRIGVAWAARQWERETYLTRQCDATIVVSQHEADLLRDCVPGANVVVLPLAREVPGTGRGYADRRGMGFIGGFRHVPNVDALNFFLREIWPAIAAAVPEAEFLVVGADLPQEVQQGMPPGARYLGPLADIRPWFDSLRLTVAPLRYGAGAKGKVASSLAHGVPCVLTRIAAEGMGLTSEREALIADDPRSFAEAVIRLYTDCDLWQRLSISGVAFAREELSQAQGLRRLREMLSAIRDDWAVLREVTTS